MNSKTKIIVLHLKEVLYTGIFAVLAILFIIILLMMFLPGRKDTPAATSAVPTSVYVPGVYTTTLSIGEHSMNVEVVVDESNINSVRLVNLSEAVTTMFPLIEPSFDELAAQIVETQSLEEITYSEDSLYTSTVLLEAIETSLEKAKAAE